MPRKPITTYAGGKGPRQKIWEAIRAKRGTEWTRYSIARTADVNDGTVATYVASLEKAGIVTISRREKTTCVAALCFYKLIRDEGIEAPRVRRDGGRVTQGLAQEQMWRTLRMFNADINTREMAAHASTPEIPVAISAANDYLQMLHAAGYLVCTAQGKGTGNGGVQSRYRLNPAHNTGPRPPMICRTKVVYDPNLDKIVYQPRVTEEDAIYVK